MNNKKYTALALSAALLLASCGAGNENAAAGGLFGAQFGGIIGSAIGGISGGPRGSDIGTLVGLAGGAVLGAAVGSAADQAQQQQYDEYKAQRQARRQYSSGQDSYSTSQNNYSSRQNNYSADSGFDPSNSGNDIITLDGSDTASPNRQPSYQGGSSDCKQHSREMMMEDAGMPALEIRNVRYVGNGTTLSSGELAKVTVEVYNNSTASLYGVQPAVVETTGNKHIFVSAPILIEKIGPGKGIKYTAMVKADKKLKDGTAHFKVFASEKAHGQQTPTAEFDITTVRQ